MCFRPARAKPDVCRQALHIGECRNRVERNGCRSDKEELTHRCVYRKFDSGWTRRTDGISSRPDEGSAQADSRRPGFALQVESKAGSRNPGPTATDQCASPAGTETTAHQQYRSFSVCLALSLVPLCSWRNCDCQAGNDHSLAPCWVSGVLALAIAQPCWQTEGLG